VLGVNGTVGRAVAAELARAGWVVRGTGRSRDRFPGALASAGVSFGLSDRRDHRALAQVIGEGTDVVVDCLCYTAAQAEQLLEHRERIGSAIVVSSKAVYVDDVGNHSNSEQPPRFEVPVREDQPVMEPDFSGEYNSRAGYGANKVAAERVLLDAGLPVTILRPSRIHGPGSSRPREWFFVRRVLDGRTRIALAHGGRTANHPTGATNLAALAAACAANPGRRVLNVADPDRPTAADIALAVADACGSRLDIVELPHGAPPEMGSNPWANWPPFFLDTSASRALRDYHPVPYPSAVGEQVRWLLSLDAASRKSLNADPYFTGLFDYDLDDQALAVYPC